MSLIFETTNFLIMLIFLIIFLDYSGHLKQLLEGQVAAEGAFGALPVFAGTFLLH